MIVKHKERTCVGCREESPKRALIRIVRTPSGEVMLDERGKLGGRGAYLCASLDCLAKARRSKALSRALKVEVPPEFYDQVQAYIQTYTGKRDTVSLRREICQLLGLSRRAGLLYIGTDKVREAKEGLLILTASDASEAVKKSVTNGEHRPLNMPMTVAELSDAIGAGNVQVIALPDENGLADKIKMLLQEGGTALEQNESV